MKFKIIINYKSVRECYMAINPMIRKILYSFIGTSLAMSIVFYCFHQIVFSAAFIAPTWLIVHNCRIAAMRLCKKYKMENEFGKVNFLPDSVEINDFYVESRIVGYESISNYYKLKHYYFFLIITNEVIPIFVDKKSLTNEEMEKLELLVQQKMPQLKNQTAKTIKQRFAFYNLHSQGDLYGM